MTRLRSTKQQVDRSLQIQLLLGVRCSLMHTSSTLQTCEYFNITLCMPWIWAVYSCCVFGVASTVEVSLARPTLSIPVIYKGFHAGKWPDLMASIPDVGIPLDRLHWNHTGWCYRPVVFQWQSRAHHVYTMEDHLSHKYTAMPREPH